MLNKELSHFAESSKSGTQVSKFLINTYMDKDDDDPSVEVAVPGEVRSVLFIGCLSTGLRTLWEYGTSRGSRRGNG